MLELLDKLPMNDWITNNLNVWAYLESPIFLQYFSVLEQLFPDNSPMYKYYCNKV